MPQLSIEDCETLLRLLEKDTETSSDGSGARALLRQRLAQGVASKPPADSRLSSCTLHVCTSCRPAGAPREPRESRPGFKLYQELRAIIDQSPMRDLISVKPAECLSLCPRPCGIALSSAGAWSYLFGDQVPGETAEDILDCVSLYLSSSRGLMPREQRPESLRSSVLGRVPPVGGQR